MFGTDPVYTLHLPRSVVLACLAALGKQPFEQVAGAHMALAAAAQEAEQRMMMAVIAKNMEESGQYGSAGP